MSASILYSENNHLGLITLNKPASLNALTIDMIQSLQTQLSHWEKDPSIHAVLIKATAGKAFCAGGDIRGLYALKESKQDLLAFFWHEYRLNYFIHQYSKPYIALMDGITMGGGVGISLHGSHAVASENFIFAMPETGIGFFPDIGASFLLAKTPLGTYLGLTGNRLNAFEARSANLISEVIEVNNFDKVIHELAATDLSLEPFKRVSACLKRLAAPHPLTNLSYDPLKIESFFCLESIQEIVTSLKKSEDEWAQLIYKQLLKKSPISLAVTQRQLARARHLDLADCLAMDYCLVSHFIKGKDFYEGVRALLVDKDNKPKWEFASLQDLPESLLPDYFEPTERKLELV